MAITKQEHEERMAMYKMGMNDYQIAEKLFLSRGSVAHWRRKHGLKANMESGGHKLSREEHEERLALYEKGLNDREIGDLCCVCATTIYDWRKKHGLKPNCPPSRKEY